MLNVTQKNRAFKGKDIKATELLLRLVVDDDYRNEHRADFEHALPDAVTSQDVGFVELIKNAPDAVASCRYTCFQGLTIICECGTGCIPECGSTCNSGFTIVCNGSTWK